MTDKIGVLGEQTVATIGTTTVYQVPAGKAARVKIMHKGVAGSSSGIKFTVNGIDIAYKSAITVSHHVWSSTDKTINSGATAPTGADATNTVGLAPNEYFLSALDIVSYTIDTANFSANNVQVVGTEVDAV